MKLLIVTQTVDKQDPILGFFHRWIEEFAKNCSCVHVFALNVGECNLPENVIVHCLGKSEGKPKLIWLWRLWKLSWSLRREYDSVFVHMNPEYVLYGAAVWKLLRKKISLWYAHGAVSKKLKKAEQKSDVIFTSTPNGFQLPSDKLKIVGQGIDTTQFAYQERNPQEKLRLVTVGRIGPSKQLETIICTVKNLVEDGQGVSLAIVGEPVTQEERDYKAKLIELIENHKLQNSVSFVGKIENHRLPEFYQNCDLFVQDGRTGSLDKAILEAISCGVPVISTNEAYKDFAGEHAGVCVYEPGDYGTLSKLIKSFGGDYKKYQFATKVLRDKIAAEHGIEGLTKKILDEF